MSLQYTIVRSSLLTSLAAATLALSGCNLAVFACAFGNDFATSVGAEENCPDLLGEPRVPPEAGTIQGRVMVEGNPVGAARIEVLGADQVRFSDGEGRFVIRDLNPEPIFLRITADRSSDFVNDLGGLAGADMRIELHNEDVFGTSEKLIGVDLGDIPLEPLVTLTGTVSIGDNNQLPGDAGVHVRVFATRAACVENNAETAGARVDARCADVDYSDETRHTRDLSVDAIAGAGDDGTFALRELLGGPLRLIAVAERIDATGVVEVLGASAPFPIDDAANANGVALHIASVEAAQTDERRLRRFKVGGEVRGQDAFVRYVPSGRMSLPCSDRAVTNLGPGDPPVCLDDMPWVCQGPVEAFGTGEVIAAVPVGLYDVTFCVGRSATFSRIVTGTGPAYSDDAYVASVPLVESGQRCPVLSGSNDCDNDGLVSLPPLRNTTNYIEDRQTWEDCADTCAGGTDPITAYGDNGEASCTVDGTTYDCDDDGDTQPDVSENPGCVGLGRGTDKDGDTLCDGYDPFPWCRSNDPGACNAIQGVPPSVPGEVQAYTFCPEAQVVEDDDYCTATSASPDCLGDYRLSCTEDNCASPAECDTGDVCQVTPAGKRCRTPCTMQAECDAAETCDGTTCVPDDEPDVMWCFCEDLRDVPGSPNFFAVPASPGASCDTDEASALWETCRGLWAP